MKALKRTMSLVLSVLIALLLLPCSALAGEPTAAGDSAAGEEPAGAEEKVVLTISDTTLRSGNRYNENMGFGNIWRSYLEWRSGIPI